MVADLGSVFASVDASGRQYDALLKPMLAASE